MKKHTVPHLPVYCMADIGRIAQSQVYCDAAFGLELVGLSLRLNIAYTLYTVHVGAVECVFHADVVLLKVLAAQR